MDSRESVPVRDAHDGGFVTKLRSDVCRMVCFLYRMLSAFYVACVLQRWCARGVRSELAN
jgi:hypothetical protein